MDLKSFITYKKVCVGNPVLANGVFAENHLRLMLRKRGGVELIFQPPYSPELNSREFWFWSVKAYFRQHEQFLIYFTELARMPAIHCGFFKFKNHSFFTASRILPNVEFNVVLDGYKYLTLGR